MQQILDYLRTLPQAERDAFAARCGTTVGYLRKAACVGQRLRAETCIHIERESGGAVTCEQLRPDIGWAHLRRPELADSEPKQAPSLTAQAQAATETVAHGVANV